jgi:hypothetical protein
MQNKATARHTPTIRAQRIPMDAPQCKVASKWSSIQQLRATAEVAGVDTERLATLTK